MTVIMNLTPLFFTSHSSFFPTSRNLRNCMYATLFSVGRRLKPCNSLVVCKNPNSRNMPCVSHSVVSDFL